MLRASETSRPANSQKRKTSSSVGSGAIFCGARFSLFVGRYGWGVVDVGGFAWGCPVQYIRIIASSDDDEGREDSWTWP